MFFLSKDKSKVKNTTLEIDDQEEKKNKLLKENTINILYNYCLAEKEEFEIINYYLLITLLETIQKLDSEIRTEYHNDFFVQHELLSPTDIQFYKDEIKIDFYLRIKDKEFRDILFRYNYFYVFLVIHSKELELRITYKHFQFKIFVPKDKTIDILLNIRKTE